MSGRVIKSCVVLTILAISACGGGGSSGGDSDSVTYSVSTSAGSGGGISPTSQSVTSGSSAVFTVTPDSGFGIVSVTGCGGNLSGNTYTTGSITAPCTVAATFATLPLAVAGYDAYASLNQVHTLGTCPSSGTLPLSYAWSLDTDGCGAGSLANPSTATPSLTPTLAGTCVVSLSITDAGGLSSIVDTVSIFGVTTAITDSSATGATVDGTISAAEYAGFTTGINSGYGNVIGATSNLHIGSTTAGQIQLGLVSVGGSLNDTVVIYIDSVSGGYADTTTFSDTTDNLLSAVSATDGTNRSDIIFPAGFGADYAVVFTKDIGALYLLNSANHTFVQMLDVLPVNVASNGQWEFAFDISSLSLAPGDSFKYFATYLTPNPIYRSNEFHGVAGTSVPGGNIGAAATTLGDQDFIVFTSYKSCN